MKTLLVIALFAAAAVAEDMMEEKPETKLIHPFAYSAYPYATAFPYHTYHTGYPYAYNTLPAVTYKVPEIKPIKYELPEVKPITYTYQPIETKFVPKEYEVPVHTVEYVAPDTACKNVFGQSVPCKTKREAPEEEKKVVPLAYPYATAFPYHAYPYATAFPYTTAAYPYTVARPVEYKALEPKVHEIEVPKPVFKKVVQKVQLTPGCFNSAGFPVPCAQYA